MAVRTAKLLTGLVTLLCLGYQINAFLSQDIFSTMNDDLKDIFCFTNDEDFEAMSEDTYTHERIITEGVKRAVIGFAKEKDPEFDMDIDTKESLSAVYKAIYGNCSSPQKFIQAVKDLSDSSARMDTTDDKDEAGFSFDGEQIMETQSNLQDMYSQIVVAVTATNKFPTARRLIGQALRVIQRFYSHSNWVEMDKSTILKGLGLPGGDLGEVAGPEEDTCDGDKVTEFKKLTSGYHTLSEMYGDAFPVPTGAKKCRHGGTKDADSLEEGINKDTGNKCFSPDANDLHNSAAKLAISATEFYINHLREIVGDRNFMQMMNLASGSALVIVMDTTSSMGTSIAAVQSQVASIIEKAKETGQTPSTYILVPYNDPGVGPVTKTEDPEVFIEKVNAMSPSGGGDIPEMFWGGLQQALMESPPYSDIICFTDAVGKDGELMPAVFSLAKARSARVSIVTSLVSRLVSDVDDYRRICDETGGLIIPSTGTSEDLDNISALLTKLIEPAKSTVMMYAQLSGEESIDFAVDDFYKMNPSAEIEVTIAGAMTKVELEAPGGKKFDVLGEEESADWNVNVNVKSAGVISFNFKPDVSGNWSLTLDSTTAKYSARIDASCTFSFISDFRLLNPKLSHPAYEQYLGQPVAGSYPVIAINMVGLDTDAMSEFTGVALLNATTSEEVRFYPGASTDVKQKLYIDTFKSSETVDGLPSDPFFIQVVGKDLNGNRCTRMLTTPVFPASTLLELTASSAWLVAAPGEVVEANFTVINRGKFGYIDVTVVDSELYKVSYSPTFVALDSDEEAIITAKFSVDASAIPGVESEITVTAFNNLDKSTNFALSVLTVVSDFEDVTPPNCSLTIDPVTNGTCDGVSEESCSEVTWVVEGTVEENGSGLLLLRFEGDNGTQFESEKFTKGSNATVNFVIGGSCCSMMAKLVAIDAKGNTGFCEIKLAEEEEVTETPVVTEIPQSDDEHCCRRVRNNGVVYFFVETDHFILDGFGCRSNCVYENKHLPGSRYCFIAGGERSQCEAVEQEEDGNEEEVHSH